MNIVIASLIMTGGMSVNWASDIPHPVPIQCPGSNAHVWDRDQCPRLVAPTEFPGGNGGNGGLLGAIGDLVNGLTGGLL